jgi:A/G-specific adenine glycosylase
VAARRASLLPAGRAPLLPPTRASSLRRRLLRWYGANRRILPWRKRSDPYRVWVAEVMLQQTQVAAVLPYYERFVERFPDPVALAAASEDEVLSLWAGLGYYARARNHHRAARACVERHGGRVPSDADALRALPGVGPYTAGAILSVAFETPALAVDGNVVRVLSRLFAIEDPDPRPEVLRRAAALVPREAPGDWTQALMELGALVCIPRAPRCGRCPVASLCAARARGIEASLPRRPAKRAPREESVLVALVRRPADAALLLLKRPETGLLAGMWAPPSLPRPAGRRAPARALEAALPWLEAREPGPVWEHRFTHRTWRCRAFACALREGAAPPEGARWASGATLGDVPTAFRKGIEG